MKKACLVAPLFVAFLMLAPAFSARGDVAGATPAGGRTFVVPSSIDATGTRDVTDELNQWIATQTSDGVAGAPNRIVLNGTFRVEYGLAIGNNGPTVYHPGLPKYTRSHVVLDLTHAALVQRNATPYSVVKRVVTERRKRWGVPMIRTLGGQDIEILGGQLTSTNVHGNYSPPRVAWHGVTVIGTNGLQLTDVHIAGVWGDFVYITPQKKVQAHSVQITGGKFERNGRQGITMNGVDGLQVTGVEFRNVQRVLFDHEPLLNGGLTNVAIHDNFGNSGGVGFVSFRPLMRTPLHDVAIDHNRFSGARLKTSIATKGVARRNVLITDNAAVGS